ncbi:SLATT domain-containing protein [Clostridium paraputrificum]|uniref:SLATT domain-containing protein n=1 Tax=Clostridium paraputrificum TaxID=29363 RepID=UPI00325B91A5
MSNDISKNVFNAKEANELAVEVLRYDDSKHLETEKYTKDKWKKIMDTTQNNYANMIKRLTRKSKVSNFTLIYYSIFLIISSLTCKYFPSDFNANLSEYFNVILSVIILAYSLVNNNANYNIRINSIENSLNEIKNLKRNLKDDNLEEYKSKYNEITDRTERRDDRDFFITVKQLAKLYQINWFTKKPKKNRKNKHNDVDGEKIVNDYLAEINVMAEVLKIVFEYLWYFLLFVIPVVVFVTCLLGK